MWQSLGVSIKIVQLSPPLETFLWQSRNFSKFENSHFGEILLLFGEILSLFWEILPTRPWNQPTCFSATSSIKWVFTLLQTYLFGNSKPGDDDSNGDRLYCRQNCHTRYSVMSRGNSGQIANIDEKVVHLKRIQI